MTSKHSSIRSSRMSRQDFIRLSGAGVAVATLTAIGGSGNALSQTNPPIKEGFSKAAEKYGVPVELLLALGYVNTRWEMPSREAGNYDPGDLHGIGGYGVMHLRQNPEVNTLGKASELTGISEEELKTDLGANIMGGAAVLAEAQGASKPDSLNGWYDTVAEFGTGTLYANQVYSALQDGVTAELESGEELELPPQEDAEPQELLTAQAAADYRRATWYGAASGNYWNGRTYDGRTYKVNRIVIHVVQGSWSGAIQWFKDGNAGVSAHYTVRSSDGKIGQSVREKDTAYHAGYWTYNLSSIGIEHEGYVSESRWFTRAMYRSSARLSAYLCRKYNIPIDRKHIIGHHEVPGCSGTGGGAGCHTDPGRNWNWNLYMRLVRKYANATSSNVYRQVVDNSSKRFRASSGWRTSSWSSQRFGKNYRYATPKRVNDFASFRIRIPTKGKYAIYARWPANSGYNSRTRFKIKTSGGWINRVVNQRVNGGRWVRLGIFNMNAGDRRWIRVSRRSPYKGYVIADAVLIKKV